MAAARTPRASWPSGPSGYYQDDYAVEDQTAPNPLLSEQREAMGVISELAILLRDTRFYLSISAGTLAAITLGVALEAAFSGWAVRRGAALGIVNFALLCGLLACWLRALLLLVTSGRPVVNTLSELRWRTGAPLDTRAPWLTLPPVGSNPEEWTWIRAHLLVGAARLTRHRLQRADTWTYVTAGAFLVWTAFLLLGL
jgi:hypothetical protein